MKRLMGMDDLVVERIFQRLHEDISVAVGPTLWSWQQDQSSVWHQVQRAAAQLSVRHAEGSLPEYNAEHWTGWVPRPGESAEDWRGRLNDGQRLVLFMGLRAQVLVDHAGSYLMRLYV